MRYLDGEFRITTSGYYDGTYYKMKGQFYDSTQVFFASMVQEGDIIYADGGFLGLPLLRYQIVSIVKSETMGATLSVIVKWDLDGQDPVEPYGTMNALIGALHPNKLTANLPPLTNDNKIVLSRAQSYHTYLLAKSNSSQELEAIKKDITNMQDKLNSAKLEWED